MTEPDVTTGTCQIYKTAPLTRTHLPEWRWRLKALNGEIVATGEGYTTKAHAIRGFQDAYTAFAHAELELEDE